MSLKPTRGLITLFGKDCARISRQQLPTLRRRIGVVFQDFRLLDHMTTYENVALPLRVLGRREDELSRRRDRAAEMGRPWRAHVGAAAGALGRRKAARRDCARADRAPEILLADEPTGNVDPPLARRLLGCSSSSTVWAPLSSSRPTTSA